MKGQERAVPSTEIGPGRGQKSASTIKPDEDPFAFVIGNTPKGKTAAGNSHLSLSFLLVMCR